MFSNDDYKEYFKQLEETFYDVLTIYTDLLNEVDDKSVRNRISSMTRENMSAYRYMKSKKEKFIMNDSEVQG